MKKRSLPELLPVPTTPRAGRPTVLSDSDLSTRRNRLLAIFESCWADIGWALQTCKKPSDLVAVFDKSPHMQSQDVTAVFSVPSALPDSSEYLRTVRRDLRTVADPRGNALDLSRKTQERLERAQRALNQATRKQLPLIRKELKLCRLEAQKAAETFRGLDDEEDQLLEKLRLSEASFSRNQLFRFIRSNRYELTPLNLANAAAGLPYMGWRQSMLRCSSDRSVSGNGPHYQVFKAIRYLCSSASKKTEEALIEHFKTRIPLLPHRYRNPKFELAKNWLFLERSIRGTCRTKVHPKSLPFEITRKFFTLSRVQSDVNILLAERASLLLKD